MHMLYEVIHCKLTMKFMIIVVHTNFTVHCQNKKVQNCTYIISTVWYLY